MFQFRCLIPPLFKAHVTALYIVCMDLSLKTSLGQISEHDLSNIATYQPSFIDKVL